MEIRLKYWRQRRSLSIDELAAQAKVSPQTIVNIELHGHHPRPKTIRKLAAGLDVTLDELLRIDLDVEEKQFDTVVQPSG